MSMFETQASTYNDLTYPVVDMASFPLAGFYEPTGANSFPEVPMIPQSTYEFTPQSWEFPTPSWEETQREGSFYPQADYPRNSMTVFDNDFTFGAAAHTSQYTPPTPIATVDQTHWAPYGMTGMPPMNALSMAGTESWGMPPREQPATLCPSLEDIPECPPWRAPGAPDWPEELKKRLDWVQECIFLPNALTTLVRSSNRRKRLQAEEMLRKHFSTGFQTGAAFQVPPTTTPTHRTMLEYPVWFSFPDNPARSCQFFKESLCSEDGTTVSSHVMIDIDNSAGPNNSVILQWVHKHFERWIPPERKKWHPRLSAEQQPDRERWSGTEVWIQAGQSCVEMLTHWNGRRECIATDRNGRSVPDARMFLPQLEHLSQPKQ